MENNSKNVTGELSRMLGKTVVDFVDAILKSSQTVVTTSLEYASKKGDAQVVYEEELQDFSAKKLNITCESVSLVIRKGKNKKSYIRIYSNSDISGLDWEKHQVDSTFELTAENISEGNVNYKIRCDISNDIKEINISLKNTTFVLKNLMLDKAAINSRNGSVSCRNCNLGNSSVIQKNGTVVFEATSFDFCSVKIINGDLLMEDCIKSDYEITSNCMLGRINQLNCHIENGHIRWEE